MKSHFSRILFLFLLPLFAIGLTQAQDVASISGTVTDPTGAIVPSVSVTLQNTATNATYKAETNAAGSYTIVNVKPGPGYKISFARDGFNTIVITNLYMNVSTTRTQNARLSVGGEEQTVQVSAANENVTLNTTDASLGNNVEVQHMNELPIQMRDNPSALFTLQPGVTLGGAVTGARTDQSSVTLDGLDVNDNATGTFGTIIGGAPVDSVQEFRAVIAGQDSNSGQGGGGQFELVTKSGTNVFHGNINEYHRDRALAANSWFNNNAGIGRPQLIRNQFGGTIGGPIKKDKLFFFFTFNARKDVLSGTGTRTVPNDLLRSGVLSYQATDGTVHHLAAGGEAAYDPLLKGADASILKMFSDRYPHATTQTNSVAGDGINTAGFKFNYPSPYTSYTYVQRVDYKINDKMSVYGRGTYNHMNEVYYGPQFPGDPNQMYEYDRSYSWVFGHNWTISTNKVNRAAFGVTHEDLNFPVTQTAEGVNLFSFSAFDAEYSANNNSQRRTFPIPELRDDFSWTKGRHELSFGGTFKWITPTSYQAENYNFYSVGTGSNATSLTGYRPSDISTANSGAYTTLWDSAFASTLGIYSSISSNYNYDKSGKTLTQGSGLDSTYRYYETEVYFGDTWKVTPELALTYGLRYQNYTVPYERNGLQAAQMLQDSTGKQTSYTLDAYWAARVKQSAAGISGDSSLPFQDYIYGGKANNGPGYFNSSKGNFAPRVALAYSPKYLKNTVLTAGGGLLYDHSILSSIQFLQQQGSGLFEANSSTSPSTASAMNNPTRFGGIGAQPAAPLAPDVTAPYVPNVSGGTPYGLANNLTSTGMSADLKNPYNIAFNVGVQTQFAHDYIFKLNYAGRRGRRLLAQADSSQLLDFPDNTGSSTQTMTQAFSAMTTQARTGVAWNKMTTQPWFEDMVSRINSHYSNTQMINYYIGYLVQRGDFADVMQWLAANGVLDSNVGLASQFAINTVWTNKGFSNYDGLLATIHKNTSHGLEFEFNYTWSHSIDNTSQVANSISANTGNGFICEIQNPRACRGNSDFDATQIFNGSFLYALPFGHGKTWGATLPKWADETLGGWSISGIPEYRTGYAYTMFSNAFVAGYAADAPAILTGSSSLTKTSIHGGSGKALYAYKDTAAVQSSYAGPIGFDIGKRNDLRGPGMFNIDLGVSKKFPIWKSSLLNFRVDAFNATNHPNFSTPSYADITASSSNFGRITSQNGSSRVLQGALRLEF